MSKKKEAVDAQITEMLEEIELQNSEEKEVRRLDDERYEFSGVEFQLIENYQDAFDLEMMEHRYTDYLLKFDYIVGDISYEKLRLRGFFTDSRKSVPLDMKISNLEDYLTEYCSFGSPYFVFERVEKKEEDPEPYFKPRRSRRSNKQRRSRRNRSEAQQEKSRKQNKNRGRRKPKQEKTEDKKQGRPTNKQNKKEQATKQTKKNKSAKSTKPRKFQVVKKEEASTKNKKTKQKSNRSEEQEDKRKNITFKIRNKKD